MGSRGLSMEPDERGGVLSTCLPYLGGQPMEHISWEEFHEIFYNQFFSSIVVEERG